ncbi:MAG: outer membrane beta-barrel family protein [Muribaculaceae bacterium]|nr:outer membrane beta-barrel family protein [Muribaculaceae bacterium]
MTPCPVNAKEVYITGQVFDQRSKGKLPGAEVKLRNMNDSSIVASTKAEGLIINNGDTTVTSTFRLYTPDNKTGYIIEIFKEGYTPHYINLDTDRLKNVSLNLGNIYLRHEVNTLSELTVTASKVKFYNKGDTIVYNADAFILPDGSMLDALIRQLPGVELRSNGQIYVNGKFVDNLVLNGKDFFKGDKNVMLENLGAYTVKNIKVYEELAGVDKLIGVPTTGKKNLVMDVRLKKDYMDSWLGNFMAGYGSSKRYAGRLFLSRLTPRSRVSLFGNFNNINATRKPGERDPEWNPSKIETGIRETLAGGIDYFYDFPDNKWKVSGNATVKHVDLKDGTSTANTIFLEPRFNYDYSHTDIHNRDLDVTTEHKVKLETEKLMWSLTPTFTYQHRKGKMNNTEALFSEEQSDWSKDFIRNIYAGGDSVRNMINRKISDEENHSNKIEYDLSSSMAWKIPNTLNVLIVQGGINGRYQKEENNEYYLLDFPNQPEMNSALLRNFNYEPNKNYAYNLEVGYSHRLRRGIYLRFTYDFKNNIKHMGRTIYDYEDADDGKFKAPSYHEQSDGREDVNNSYRYRLTNMIHSLSPGLNISHGNLWVQLSWPFIIATDNLHYWRGDYYKSIRRTNLLFEQSNNSFVQYQYKGNTWFATATYTTKAPDLLDVIDVTDTSNPLVIEKGNPDLKKSGLLKVNASYSFSKPRDRFYVNLSFDYNAIHNALAKGAVYDEATGVKTVSTYNVNGNRSMVLSNYLGYEFGPMKMFSIKHLLSATYRKSVDVIGITNSIGLNTVYSHGIGENLSFGVTHSGQKISLTGNIDYSRYSGDARFNPLEFHYGVLGLFKLPFGLGINTDFTIYSRRHYQDKALNTNNYIWNMRLTYGFLKGSLLLTVDGFDLLHDLSNVFYTVNAQARTETYRTVLPRYIMVGLQWKFNTKK